MSAEIAVRWPVYYCIPLIVITVKDECLQMSSEGLLRSSLDRSATGSCFTWLVHWRQNSCRHRLFVSVEQTADTCWLIAMWKASIVSRRLAVFRQVHRSLSTNALQHQNDCLELKSLHSNRSIYSHWKILHYTRCFSAQATVELTLYISSHYKFALYKVHLL